jgi:hypothetical protein
MPWFLFVQQFGYSTASSQWEISPFRLLESTSISRIDV